MFCPVCKTEYREEYRRCADCGAPLVESLPKSGEDDFRDGNTEYIFLTNVPDGPPGEATLGLLRAFDIPHITKYADAGKLAAIFTGRSPTGVDILVRSDCFKAARDILHGTSVLDNAGDEEICVQAEFSRLSEEFYFEACNIINYYTVNNGYPYVDVESVIRKYTGDTANYPAFVMSNFDVRVGIVALVPCAEEQVGLCAQAEIFIKPELFNQEFVVCAAEYLSRVAASCGYRILIAADTELTPILLCCGFVESEGRLLKNLEDKDEL